MSVTQLFKRKITKDESRDTGMAMVLLMLLFFVFKKKEGYVAAAMVLHVVNMTAPTVFKPVAVVWLGLSHVLGMVVSRILLSLVFLLVVTPVAIVRKALGKDAMKLRGFKSSQESVMVVRNHTFTAEDLKRPF